MKMAQEGNELVIRVPLNVKPVGSKSGKSRIVGGSGGYVSQGTDFGIVKICLNVITTDEDFGKVSQPQPKLVKAS
jgi:hypothetical protein